MIATFRKIGTRTIEPCKATVNVDEADVILLAPDGSCTQQCKRDNETFEPFAHEESSEFHNTVGHSSNASWFAWLLDYIRHAYLRCMQLLTVQTAPQVEFQPPSDCGSWSNGDSVGVAVNRCCASI